VTGEQPSLLPLHVSLAGRRVLVVGGGVVADRKINSALNAGADVVVVAPAVIADIALLTAAGRIRWIRRRFRASDLRRAWLVYTATGVEAVDSRVSEVARRRRTFCIRADHGVAGSARSAAPLRRKGILISVSSEGEPDPRRVAAVRDALGEAIDSRLLRLPGAHREVPGTQPELIGWNHLASPSR
jgi:uroporphyrin-III C-methyltransferase/precorrin-2 dehydrogenase/sirohydrochlorin ferrochelatase